MASQKKSRYEVMRPAGESLSCIACGCGTTFSVERELIYREKEEWKSIRNELTIVSSKEIESMYFRHHPWIWTSFSRAIIYDPATEQFRVGGIIQHRMTYCFEPDPVPRDPHKARIGYPLELAGNLEGFDRFLLANMLQPELSDRSGPLGYLIHAHCWVLIDRVVGLELVERELRLFVDAVHQFWKENQDIWRIDQLYSDYDDPFYPPHSRLKKTRQITGNIRRKDRTRCVWTWKNPLIVPEIQTLINQAVSGHHENEGVLLRSQEAAIFDIPVEIAMMIVNIIYKDIYYGRAGIHDLQNMLAAFQWRLPDSYWQRRCKKDLIFEIDDLIRSNSQKVDWQFLCLGTEELLLRKGWYDRGGLKNRGRILSLLQGLKKIFLNKIKQQDRW